VEEEEFPFRPLPIPFPMILEGEETKLFLFCIGALGFPNYGYFPAAPGVPTPGSTSNADRANMAAVAAASGYYDYSAAQVRAQHFPLY